MIAFPASPELGEQHLPEPADFSNYHPFLKGVFSQWHPTPFALEGVRFTCSEQYMMAAKAALFGDRNIADQVMAADEPALQKRLGAQVSGFDEAIWREWRIHIVYSANRAKFGQNAGARRQLANTAPAMLVEANPRDWNWGNGLQLEDSANNNPRLWRGDNLLGRILTYIRIELEGAKL